MFRTRSIIVNSLATLLTLQSNYNYLNDIFVQKQENFSELKACQKVSKLSLAKSSKFKGKRIQIYFNSSSL